MNIPAYFLASVTHPPVINAQPPSTPPKRSSSEGSNAVKKSTVIPGEAKSASEDKTSRQATGDQTESTALPPPPTVNPASNLSKTASAPNGFDINRMEYKAFYEF